MRTRDLKEVHRELTRNWQQHSLVEISRTGTRDFWVISGDETPPGFNFDRGWTPTTSTNLPVGHSDPLRAIRNRPWVIMSSVVLIVSALVIGVSVFTSTHPTTFHTNPASTRSVMQKSGPRVQEPKSSTGCPRTPTEVLSTLGVPVPVGGLREGVATFQLLRDVTIGGERQQVVAVKCDSVTSGAIQYALRYWLDGSTWKAKSATPVGSHSRLN